MTREAPLDLAGLAELAGIGYRSAVTYRSSGLLPEPDGFSGRSPWWWPTTVRAWLVSRDVPSSSDDGA